MCPCILCLLALILRRRISTLFPYTTLFRSANELAASGTNRGAHGNFFFAGSGASEKQVGHVAASEKEIAVRASIGDRKSTRLNSSHGYISYAVFCLKKKKKKKKNTNHTMNK